ncbi:MAG: hypothetical protein M2R45_04256 [Verrucomicrobia subdivision 3 bacterium]|nr:hypothetical protein [Limisphaerales bacterium]MCS1412617.1 hypothetical protein [Limisphaerales bacterium]
MNTPSPIQHPPHLAPTPHLRSIDWVTRSPYYRRTKRDASPSGLTDGPFTAVAWIKITIDTLTTMGKNALFSCRCKPLWHRTSHHYPPRWLSGASITTPLIVTGSTTSALNSLKCQTFPINRCPCSLRPARICPGNSEVQSTFIFPTGWRPACTCLGHHRRFQSRSVPLE